MICLDGNIGAGKSQVIDGLKRRGIHAIPEPVELWSLLPLFYNNPSKYGFALQTQILSSYAGVSTNAIVERGALSAYGVFATMLKNDNLITEHELSMLATLYMSLPIEKVKMLIYLDVDDSLCLERIKKRGRACETNINLEYIEKIRKNYDIFLEKIIQDDIKVIRINASLYDGNVEQLVEVVVKELRLFS